MKIIIIRKWQANLYSIGILILMDIQPYSMQEKSTKKKEKEQEWCKRELKLTKFGSLLYASTTALERRCKKKKKKARKIEKPSRQSESIEFTESFIREITKLWLSYIRWHNKRNQTKQTWIFSFKFSAILSQTEFITMAWAKAGRTVLIIAPILKFLTFVNLRTRKCLWHMWYNAYTE